MGKKNLMTRICAALSVPVAALMLNMAKPERAEALSISNFHTDASKISLAIDNYGGRSPYNTIFTQVAFFGNYFSDGISPFRLRQMKVTLTGDDLYEAESNGFYGFTPPKRHGGGFGASINHTAFQPDMNQRCDAWLDSLAQMILGVSVTGSLVSAADNCTVGNAIDSADPPSPVPEPGTIFLLGTALLGLGGIARKKRNSKLQG